MPSSAVYRATLTDDMRPPWACAHGHRGLGDLGEKLHLNQVVRRSRAKADALLGTSPSPPATSSLLLLVEEDLLVVVLVTDFLDAASIPALAISVALDGKRAAFASTSAWHLA